MSNFLELTKSRRSVRTFDGKMIDSSLLEELKSYSFAPALVSSLQPSSDQLDTSAQVAAVGVATEYTLYELQYCVAVEFVALFIPELNVIVLVYVAFNVFGTSYAGL